MAGGAFLEGGDGSKRFRQGLSGYAPGKPTLSRSSSFSYDATSGLLITETLEPGNNLLSVTTTYGYDPYGNKTAATVSGAGITVDAAGTAIASGTVSRTTSTTFDTAGRFPATSSNALGHQETYVYDNLLGVMTSLTGPNGLVTSWIYDSFGAKIQENRADGTNSQRLIKWAGPAAPSGTVYQVETKGTSSAPALAYYDRFGRVFRSLTLNGSGEIVYQDTSFDNQGRTYATSVPYRAGGSIYNQISSYDLIGRVVASYTPDDQVVGGVVTTAFSYSGLTTSVTDAKGRVTTSVKNSQGWMISNTRNVAVGGSAADYAQVTYDYDAYGNLISTNAAGVVTTLGYDARGRKVTMTDPDMGTWQYCYNIFGELIWQKDNKTPAQITTLTYDVLGRLVTRVEPTEPGLSTGTTTWTYDTAAKAGGGFWKGQLASVASPGAYTESYTYDSLGRPSTLARTIGSDGTYIFTTTYDTAGRVLKTQYPTVNGGNFATRNVYNSLGFLKEIRAYLASDDAKTNDQLQGRLFWQTDHYSSDGRVDGETYGNGLANDRIYSQATGRLLSSAIDRGRVVGAPYAIQQMVYTYDTVGNVLTRADTAVGRGESFGYDGLDRLTTHSIVTGAGSGVTVAYNQLGNITAKSDVGNYAYHATKRHAVIGVSGGPLGAQTYTYDANGNMTGGGGRTITWTAFNQVATIVKGGYTSTFSFGASHERVKHVSHLETTLYVGGLFEKVTPVGASPVTEYRHYIMAPTGRVAVYTDRSNLARDTKYYHTDGLGSITAISDEKGAIVKRFAFDAWGKRIDPASGATVTGATAAGLRRGFTDHEQLDDLGLVHMNGRVFDPVLGRFSSADPFVDGVSDSQGFNRYSYLTNNPLGGSDPSGFFSLKDTFSLRGGFMAIHYVNPLYWAAPGFYRQTAGAVNGIAVAGIITYASGGTLAAVGAAVGGFVSGFEGSLLNGASVGDAFRSGMIGAGIGAATGYLAGQIGAKFDGMYSASTTPGQFAAIEGGRRWHTASLVVRFQKLPAVSFGTDSTAVSPVRWLAAWRRD